MKNKYEPHDFGKFPPQLWGHSIRIRDHGDESGTFNVYGWIIPRPQIGDTFSHHFQKGGYARLQFIEVTHDNHVNDMFFGVAESLYYEDDHTRRPGR